MMRTVFARPVSLPPVMLPTIVVTAPDNEPAPPVLPPRSPYGYDNGLLQVPRRASSRQTQVKPPLIRFERPPRLVRPRPQPIPVPEPVPVAIPVPVIEEPKAQLEPQLQVVEVLAPINEDLPESLPDSPCSPPPRGVLDTLSRLERYCESIVVNARARPQAVELAAPKPVAGGNFKKAHRRVHSVDISWNRAPPSGGRPGVANPLAQRRKRSISSADEIFIGAPKAALSRSERSTSTARRAIPRGSGIVSGLPDLIEDHPATPGRVVRSRSFDTVLCDLLRPQPTMLSTRSGRADLGSLLGATTAASNANMLPEGFMPAASLGVAAAVGYYATLSKNATTLRQKVFKPLRRYITV